MWFASERHACISQRNWFLNHKKIRIMMHRVGFTGLKKRPKDYGSKSPNIKKRYVFIQRATY